MIMKIYDDASSGIKLYISVFINIYVSTLIMCRTLTVCQVLLYLPKAILTITL